MDYSVCLIVTFSVEFTLTILFKIVKPYPCLSAPGTPMACYQALLFIFPIAPVFQYITIIYLFYLLIVYCPSPPSRLCKLNKDKDGHWFIQSA